MRKIILILAAAFLLSGCLAEKIYRTGKVVYVGAKRAYIELDLHNETLENIDEIVVKVDRIKSNIDKKLKKNDADSLPSGETGSNAGGE